MKKLYFNREAIFSMFKHFTEMVNLYENKQRTLIALQSELDNELLTYRASFDLLLKDIKDSLPDFVKNHSKGEAERYIDEMIKSVTKESPDKIDSEKIISMTNLFNDFNDRNKNIFKKFVKDYLSTTESYVKSLKKLKKTF